MAKAKVISGGGPACKCTPGGLVWLVVGVIVVALGLWAGVKGFVMQFNGSTDWMRIVFWYALGLLVMGVGKIFKCKACPACWK